jgi:4-amino-4-deoxy-L-arabinose transferase-like glycosyltransferase
LFEKEFELSEKGFLKVWLQPWVQIILLAGFCFFLYFLNLGQWDLWNPDEPRYAQVAKEMVSRGDWILMHYNGKVYPDKPPLFFWLIGLSSYLWQGFSSFAVRLVPALFGTLTVLLTFLFGKHFFSSRAGFLSGLILATSFEFAYLSTRANIDTTLTFFTTASLLCFFLWYRYSSSDPYPFFKSLSIYGFYTGMAFATLAKGPVGFILPLLVTLLFLLAQKDWRGIKAMRLLPGMILFLAIVLAWYLPAVLRGGSDYLYATLVHHSIDRFEKGVAHIRPFYYYLYQFPVGFLPWILFLPAAMMYGYSRVKIEKRREFFFILLWFALIFIFFSSSRGKRSLYLLPLYPAAALLVGKLWDDLLSHPTGHFRHKWISFPLYGFIGLGLIAGAAMSWAASIKFHSSLPYQFPITFILVGGSIVMLISYRFKNYRAILFFLIGMLFAGYMYTFRVIFPLANPSMSARFLSEEVTSRIRPGEKLAIYKGLGTDPYNYYTGIVPIMRLETKEDFSNFIESSERVFCLLKFSDFSQLIKKEGELKIQLITRRKVRKDDIVLISNQ